MEDQLIDAVDENDYEEVRSLIEKGGIINYKVLYEIIFNNENLELLKKVIRYVPNDEDITKILLKCINQIDQYTEFIDLLITKVKKINLSEEKLNDLLYEVIVEGCNLKLVKFLIKSGAIVDSEIIKAAYETGNRYNDSTVLEFLLERLGLTKMLAKTWLNDWVFKKMNHKKALINLPIGIEKFYKRNKEETVYRGLYWNSEDIKENFYKLIDSSDYSKYKVNSKLVLNLRDLTSWSKSEYIAEDFAKRSIAKHAKFFNVVRYGIVLKLNVAEKNILADVNKTLKINHEEKEIIVYPGKYECEILKIFLNGKEINSLSSFNLYKEETIDN